MLLLIPLGFSQLLILAVVREKRKVSIMCDHKSTDGTKDVNLHMTDVDAFANLSFLISGICFNLFIYIIKKNKAKIPRGPWKSRMQPDGLGNMKTRGRDELAQALTECLGNRFVNVLTGSADHELPLT